jgi:hypothetical protein
LRDRPDHEEDRDRPSRQQRVRSDESQRYVVGIGWICEDRSERGVEK